MAIQHLAAPAPAAPGPGEPALLPAQDRHCSQHRTLLSRGCPGEGPSPGKSQGMGFHAQGTCTKANRLVFPSPKVSVWGMLFWYHHQQKQKSTYRTVHISARTSWPQGFGCIYWDPVSALSPRSSLLKPPCGCQPRGWHSPHTAAREGEIAE